MAEARKRPLVRIKETQAILLDELKREMPQEQRTAILLKLADLELASQKRHQRRRLPIGPRKKIGRPRKQYDSHGEPLYQDTPVRLKSDEVEIQDSKSKFLSTLKSEEKSNAI